MASSIALREIPRHGAIKVLDPMVGSGTSVAIARKNGHKSIGFDLDPLAVMISRATTADVDKTMLLDVAEKVLRSARKRCRTLRLGRAYPSGATAETKAFVRYWFDERSRLQLASLATAIRRCRCEHLRTLLWCAFSRLIVTKSKGVSLAMDVSHSRPHRVYDTAPVRPFEAFLRAVKRISNRTAFGSKNAAPLPKVRTGDARKLPVRSNTVDFVITSPPYLNAIDYLRGHRLSLVWMGYNVGELRTTRTESIGTERSSDVDLDPFEKQLLDTCSTHLHPKAKRMLARYIVDMSKVMSEIARVLKNKCKAVIVVGDSSIRGAFVRNSEIISQLGERNRLRLLSRRSRRLPDHRRYLPPPSSRKSGERLQARMRTEVVLKFVKRCRRSSNAGGLS